MAGVGGQGILRAARLIAGAAHHQELMVSIGETFGASRRGGPVVSHIRLSQFSSSAGSKTLLTGALVPHHMADVLVGLEPLETLRAAQFLNPDSVVLLNTHFHPPVDVIANKSTAPLLPTIQSRLQSLSTQLWAVDTVKLAQQAGEIRTANTVMIGVLAGLQLTPINKKSFYHAVSTQFTQPLIQTLNQKAFKLGLQYSKKKP